MRLTIVSSSTPPVWQRIEQRLKERHADITTIRNKRMNTIKKDFDRVYKDEVAFTKSLIKDNFPLEIEVDENYFNNFPIRIRPKKPLTDLFNDAEIVEDDNEMAEPLDN